MQLQRGVGASGRGGGWSGGAHPHFNAKSRKCAVSWYEDAEPPRKPLRERALVGKLPIYEDVESTAAGHVLTEARLVGTYQPI
jgi:hypothetical protein